jgi:hypothetical protein
MSVPPPPPLNPAQREAARVAARRENIKAVLSVIYSAAQLMGGRTATATASADEIVQRGDDVAEATLKKYPNIELPE